MNHKFETLLYAIIFTIWIVRLYYKLYDKKTRKYILGIGFLIVFWMIIRISKSIVVNPSLERFIWYLYYIPLIFIPTLFYVCSKTLSKKVTKINKIIIYSISTLFLLLVLTNDFHMLTFKFPNGISLYNNYYHFIGYYIVSIWIFYLFGRGMVNLALNRFRIKKDFKAFLPIIVLLLGVIYTVLYILNIGIIREINMSIFNSVLICIGIELTLYLDLIPNNSKYIKLFENSDLNMMIASTDFKTIYKSKKFTIFPDFILNDIKNNKLKRKYEKNNIIYEIKKNKNSYVIIRKNIEELNKLKDELTKKQKNLLLQQENIKKEEQIKKDLYEINLRKKVINSIENKLNEKRIQAKKLLEKSDLSKEDLEKIKRIIIYSKKKSLIMISSLNGDIYNEENVKILLNELIKSVGIDGVVIIKDKINIKGNEMSLLYDILYEVLDNISKKTIIVYVNNNLKNFTLKIVIGDTLKLKDKLKLDKNIKIKEKIYDTDTELLFTIGVDNI